ncbi:MAG TPA: hypothetical protein VE262_15540 [Blastocatellia bacterium]|nr:hypothetical protein [Blastocatellia bacterium]
MKMPFKNDHFDVVVFDPPHIPNQGKDQSEDFNTRFGLVMKSPIETALQSHPTEPRSESRIVFSRPFVAL